MTDAADAKPPEPPPAPPAAPPPPPAAPPEVLSEDEVVGDDAEALAALLAHKKVLEEMPDGRRPFPAGTQRPSWRRRTYVVDWKLQLNYASVYIATVTLLILGFVVLNMIFYFFAQRMLALHTKGPIPEAENFTYYLFANAVFIVLLAIGMALYAIIQSHRVAGPALRFRRALRQMLRRDYDFYLQLRQKDYLKDIAEQMNVLNNAIKAKDIVLADAALRLADQAKTLEEKGHDATPLKDVAREIAELVLPLPEPTEGDPELGARVDGTRKG
jgi:hypothetical protein